MKIIVCDIDGTIADCSHRLHYIQGDKKDWEKFFGGVDNDKPIEDIIDIIKTLNYKYEIVFVSGRNEICEQKTREWIYKNIGFSFQKENIRMRKQNDRRPDTEVKPELLEQYLKENPDSEVAFILEDRDSMVKKWRELGYTCLQVCDGKF